MSIALWDRQQPPAQQPGERPGRPKQPRGDGAPRWTAYRRRAIWAGIGVVVLVAAAVMTLGGRGLGNQERLDPRNATYNGTQALANVLDQRGVRVTIARGEQELRRSGIDGNTTVVVSRATELGQTTTRNLAQLSRQAERLVIIGPESRVVRDLDPQVIVRLEPRTAAALVSECENSDVRKAERLSHSSTEFQSPRQEQQGACFTNDGYSAYLSLPRTAALAPLVLLGSSSAVANETISANDNAAVVLRALGHSDRLVWYVPDFRDIPLSDLSRSERLVPDWLGPSVLLVTFAMLGLFFWRGRRLGRLVTEPLPVVIRAIETTESRGRMYRRAKDAARAGAVLQEATRRRLAGYLGLPPAGPPHALAQAVGTVTGRRVEEIEYLLGGAPPTTDTEMLGLAAALTALEKEVARS